MYVLLANLGRNAEACARNTSLVSRHGRPIAQIGPVLPDSGAISPREAMQRLRALALRLDHDEIRDLRDAGRRV